MIEDDAALREFYRSTLRAHGYAVVAVEDGIDALRQIEHSLPDLVVLDLALPRLNGRDVYRELKARHDTGLIPILVVSGEDTSDLDPTDFACLIRKPVSVDALLDAVRDCLRRRSAAG